MLYTYQNETVRYTTVLKDFGGTALNSETPIIHVENTVGSNVFNGTGTFSATGSYYVQTNVPSSWGTGPIKYWWTVAGANGTAQEIRTNEQLILAGTSELAAYAFEAELPNYYSRIEDYDMSQASFKLTERYHYINRLLDTLNINTPRLKNDDGQYDYSIRAMNAWYAIYDIVMENQVNRVAPDEDPWYNKFKEEGDKIYDDIKKKKIVFRDQVAPSDSGIGVPSRTVGSSIGSMFNNWDNSWGNGFQGADFGRTWTVEIIGTNTGLFDSYARYSSDMGQTYGTLTTAFDWLHLGDEVFVRFEKGTATGTTGIFATGDKWEFTTQPNKRTVGGQNSGKSY